jgi:putative aldouronate transport system substrate-binding protein
MFPKLHPDRRVMSFDGFQLRRDWLTRLRLKVPTTIDEWELTLARFRDDDPNGNLDADELPFGAAGVEGLEDFAAAWGVRRGFYPDPISGRMTYGPLEPAYREFLATMARWYAAGLIDPEFAAVDSTSLDRKVTDDVVGSYFGAVSRHMGRYLGLMRGNSSFDLVGAPWPVGPARVGYATNDALVRVVHNDGAAVAADSPRKLEAVRLLDYGYSDEGRDLLNWGIEGVSYVQQGGKRRMTGLIAANPQGLPPDLAVAQYAFPHLGCPTVSSYEARVFTNLAFPQQREASERWAQGDLSLLLPNLAPTAGDGARMATIMNDVEPLERDMFVRIVMGIGSLDDYEVFLESLGEMGIGEAVAIQQRALDGFRARR